MTEVTGRVVLKLEKELRAAAKQLLDHFDKSLLDSLFKNYTPYLRSRAIKDYLDSFEEDQHKLDDLNVKGALLSFKVSGDAWDELTEKFLALPGIQCWGFLSISDVGEKYFAKTNKKLFKEYILREHELDYEKRLESAELEWGNYMTKTVVAHFKKQGEITEFMSASNQYMKTKPKREIWSEFHHKFNRDRLLIHIKNENMAFTYELYDALVNQLNSKSDESGSIFEILNSILQAKDLPIIEDKDRSLFAPFNEGFCYVELYESSLYVGFEVDDMQAFLDDYDDNARGHTSGNSVIDFCKYFLYLADQYQSNIYVGKKDRYYSIYHYTGYLYLG